MESNYTKVLHDESQAEILLHLLHPSAGNDPSLGDKAMIEQACIAISQVFQHYLKKFFIDDTRRTQLAGYFNEKLWIDAQKAATHQCWAILRAMPEHVCAALEEAKDALSEGQISASDVVFRVCSAVVQDLKYDILEAKRDKAYHNICKVIAEHAEDGRPRFYTATRNGKIYFSPVPTSEFTERPDKQEMEKWIRHELCAPSFSIRKVKTFSTDDGPVEKKTWDGKVLSQEARRFWEAFVNRHCGGRPGFVPVYALYWWLSKHFDDIGTPLVKSLDEPAGGDDEELATLGDTIKAEGMPIDSYADAEEARQIAKDFVNSLPWMEGAVCSLLFAKGATMESTAKALGLKGASSITRYKNQLIRKIREQATMYDDESFRDAFILAIHEECRKRYPLSNEAREETNDD